MFTNTATDHVVTVTTQPSEGDMEQLELHSAISEGKLITPAVVNMRMMVIEPSEYMESESHKCLVPFFHGDSYSFKRQLLLRVSNCRTSVKNACTTDKYPRKIIVLNALSQ